MCGKGEEDLLHMTKYCESYNEERADLMKNNKWTKETQVRLDDLSIGEIIDKRKHSKLLCFLQIIYSKRHRQLYTEEFKHRYWYRRD